MIGWTEELISLLVNSTINYQEETTQKTIPGSNWSPRLCKTCKDKEPPIKPKLKKKKTTSPWDGGAGMKIRGYNPQPPPSSVNILPLHLCVPPDLLAKEAQATHLSACSPSESLFPLKYILTLLSCRGKKKEQGTKGLYLMVKNYSCITHWYTVISHTTTKWAEWTPHSVHLWENLLEERVIPLIYNSGQPFPRTWETISHKAVLSCCLFLTQVSNALAGEFYIPVVALGVGTCKPVYFCHHSPA